MKRYYLAYGSNLNLAQMKLRCPDAKVMGVGQVDGYELLFKGSKTGAYLTIEEKEGGSVPVAVWSVSGRDESNLDRYEGHPAFYYKANTQITYQGILTGRKRTVKAFIYIMHEDRPLGIPTEYYVRTCMEGYRAFGFDQGLLIEAMGRSEHDERANN